MKKLLVAILSLSMATALVGTGISPALNSIKEYFYNAPSILIQMVVSLPSLLMVAVAIPFSAISNRFSMKAICIAGLVFYTVGGVGGCFANNIYVMMLSRIIIGIGYGLLMPMTVGLLSYFFKKEEQAKLNGYIIILTSAISIISMALVGYLADISWRLCFLVYLFGLPCIWLTAKYIPSTTLNSPKNHISLGLLKKIWPYAIGIFVMMMLYFSMLNNFAIIATGEGTVSTAMVGVVMSIQTVASLFTGIYLNQLKQLFGKNTKYAIWGFALIGVALLCFKTNVIVMSIGLASFGIGLAMGVGLFNSQSCIVCDKEESLSATSIISLSRCLGQFSSPIILSGIQGLFGSTNPRFPYYSGVVFAVLMLLLFTKVNFEQEQKV